MKTTIDDMVILIQKVQSLSGEIASMKIRTNMMEPGPDRDQLRQDIKMKQYQALFYIEKMGNVE